MNINDLFQASANAEDTGYADLLTDQELPDGTEVLCQITYSKAGSTKKGAPSWTNKLKVLEGEHAGGEFFDSIYLSANQTDGALGYNKRQFAKLTATGIGAQFFSTNPSGEAIAKAIKDKQVVVKIKWQKQSDEDKAAGKSPFGEHSWSPASEASDPSGPAGFSRPTGF